MFAFSSYDCLISILTTKMLEKPSSATQQKIKEIIYHSPQLKLPKIDKFPPKGLSKIVKSSTRLPILKSEPLISSSDFETDWQLEKDYLVEQVQKRLRIVMIEQNIAEIAENSQSDDQGFQKKIIANKEIIKETKLKNQKEKKEKDSCNKIGNRSDETLIKKVKLRSSKLSRQQNNLRQSSIENKQTNNRQQLVTAFYQLGMKDCKQFISKSNNLLKQMNSSVKEDQILSAKVENLEIIKSEQCVKYVEKNKKIKQQLSGKFLEPVQKNQKLFQAIHNYLDNPQRNETQYKPLRATKQELQLKIRKYQEQLIKENHLQVCKERSLENENITQKKYQQLSVHHYLSRIGGELNTDNSFEKEVDRIQRYLLRNQKSLEKYIDNQKILLEVQLSRKYQENQGRTEKSKKKKSI